MSRTENCPNYAGGVGLRLLQVYEAEPGARQPKPNEIQQLLAEVAGLDPALVESVVLVVRSKTTGPSERPGFNLMVSALGVKQLVVGSVILLQEAVEKELGGGVFLEAALSVMGEMVLEAEEPRH